MLLLVVLAWQIALAAVDIAIRARVEVKLHLLVGQHGATAVVRTLNGAAWTQPHLMIVDHCN